MFTTGNDAQALSKAAQHLISDIEEERDSILRRNPNADAALREAVMFAGMVFLYLQMNNFEAALDCGETAESLYLSLKDLPLETEAPTPGPGGRNQKCDEPMNASEAPDLKGDQSDAIFRAELSGLAIPPRIRGVMEEARGERKAIWGSQAGFGQFVKSTYFPLLLCLDDPQERPRAVLQAVNAGNTRLADLYRQSIGLSEYFNPGIKPRIRNTQWFEDWRSEFMIIEIIAQMRWLEATRDRNAYIRCAVLRAFQNRQSEEEHEHIKAGKAGAVIEYLDDGQEVEDWWPSIAALEFELDFDSSVVQANKLGIKGEEFPQIMRDWVLSGHTWEMIAARKGVPPEQRKHFSDTAKRLYEPKLRCFRERMKAYYRPPRKTIDERLAAARRSRPGLANNTRFES